MREKYKALILIITSFPIIFICPVLLNSIKYYPSKLIFNVFYLGVIVVCYGSLFIWSYYIIKFVRGVKSNG